MLNYYEIGQRVRKYRKAHQLAQEELAKRVGISTTHMSHIETGNTKLSLPVLAALATYLEVGADDLLFETSRTSRGEAVEDVLSILDGCSAQQLKVIKDIITAAKRSMDKHM